MAQAVVCDGCGNPTEYISTMQIRSMSIEEGSIQIDLCSICSAPVRELPAFQNEKNRLAQEIKDRAAQVAQEMLEEAQRTEE